MMIGLAIDPGVSTGICLFSWDDYTPIHILHVWHLPDGASGTAAALDWINVGVKDGVLMMGEKEIDALVVEKFTPRPNANFNHTRKSTEPLRVEGVLIGRGFEPFIQWAEPKQQYFMGDSQLPLDEKKRLAKEFLKEHGMYVTGKAVGKKDADDAISATLHAVSWMRRKRHMPTMEKLFAE
jgi:hypothetical protein